MAVSNRDTRIDIGTRADTSGASIQTGAVKWFNQSRGFGFIIPDSGGEDIFVHHTAIVSDGFRVLEEGERVSFEVEMGSKGMKATRVYRHERGERR